MINWKGMEQRNKKNISKRPGNKWQPIYSGKLLFKMMLLSNGYNLSDVGTEELVKKLEMYELFWFSIERSSPIS
ncbi:MAG: hypothetical protein ACMUEL_00860 [Flavobacteriales bacterium Tduv]